MSESRKRRRSEGRARTYRNARRLGWLFSILVTIAVLCLVFFVWFAPVQIQDNSMAPGLNSGEVVLCDRIGKFVRLPERGDIVLFSTQDGLFLKRIVGMPGETVELVFACRRSPVPDFTKPAVIAQWGREDQPSARGRGVHSPGCGLSRLS